MTWSASQKFVFGGASSLGCSSSTILACIWFRWWLLPEGLGVAQGLDGLVEPDLGCLPGIAGFLPLLRLGPEQGLPEGLVGVWRHHDGLLLASGGADCGLLVSFIGVDDWTAVLGNRRGVRDSGLVGSLCTSEVVCSLGRLLSHEDLLLIWRRFNFFDAVNILFGSVFGGWIFIRLMHPRVGAMALHVGVLILVVEIWLNC